jgi:hypothetical protein
LNELATAHDAMLVLLGQSFLPQPLREGYARLLDDRLVAVRG